jgi:hypothetical protein
LPFHFHFARADPKLLRRPYLTELLFDHLFRSYAAGTATRTKNNEAQRHPQLAHIPLFPLDLQIFAVIIYRNLKDFYKLRTNVLIACATRSEILVTIG